MKPERPKDRRGTGTVIGLITAAVALTVGQLVAAFISPGASPLLAVGETIIDASPEWLRSFAIRTFGSGDKTALLAGILIVLAVAAVFAGIAASRRRSAGFGALAGLGALGALAALWRPGSNLSWTLPSIAGALAGAGALSLILPAPIDEPHERPAPTGFDRRRFFKAALALSAAAVASEGIGRFIENRHAADASRSAVGLPTPESPAGPLPAGAQLRVPGISPYTTPNDAFYRVDTTLFVPHIPVERWTLRIHGMVDHPMELTFAELLARPLIERDITLNCVSNPVGGRYVGNARWIGAPLKDLLDEAGVRPDADQIVGRSSDGMTIGTPSAVALDGRDAMLAVAMNGEPLPFEHGFPVRMLVPGLYGYESATKWLVDLELTTLAAYQAYWVQRGWAQVAPIQTASRIDTPSGSVKAGEVTVAGVAWAQHRGISRVEVRIDAGAWNPAELATENTPDTWRQWRFSWDATAGDHAIEVRAIDRTGAAQTGDHAPPFPSGSTGWDRIDVSVT